MTAQAAFRISAVVGFLGVALGAFGAHALQEALAANERVSTWETATLYHLIHAVVLCGVSAMVPFRRGVWWSFFLGVLIFSGSLYTLCLTNVTKLGMVTPLGGLAFLVGWSWLAVIGLKRTS